MGPSISNCKQCGFNNPPGMRFCGNCGARLEEGSSPAAAGPISPDQLGVMMGADLGERFRQAGLQAAGQRRNVTVLFVDLTGYTQLSERIDSELLYDLIRRFILVLINAVYKYEGAVDKLTGDGLMALFGAPIAHENNAERALRAALDMHADVEKLSRELDPEIHTHLQLHIGLHSGSVIVGEVGTHTLMNYTAIGDTVNLAKRLEEAADPGFTLVSEAVYRACRQIFDFNPLPAQALKGISQAVTAFRVVGAKAKTGPLRGLEGLHAPMIGRQAELGQVLQVIEQAVQQRKGHLILVVGEAGMGKSRLNAEVKARIPPGTITLLEGNSLTYRKAVSYWIFQDVLRAYLGVTVDTPGVEVRQALRAAVERTMGPEGEVRLPFLEQVLAISSGLGTPPESLRYLDAGQVHRQIYLAVRDLLIAEARRNPVVLFLEDLHWADEASLDLILLLLDVITREPLVIYANTRPHEVEGIRLIEERAGQRLSDHFTTLHLQALQPEQSAELLAYLLSAPELPDELRTQIIQRSAGLPFYLEEILRMLIEDHVLYNDDGHWRAIPGMDTQGLGVPDTLQRLILARYDRLNLVQRRVIQTASVIGQQFALPVLDAVLEKLPIQETHRALKDLIEREFIVPIPDLPEPSYTFRHVLVTDAIYSTLLQRDRKELHGKVGQVIETLFAGRLDNLVELLANHYLKSNLTDRALHYLILAGLKLLRSNANAQARQHFEQAVEVLEKTTPTPEQVVQVHMSLGDMLVITGEYHAARDHFMTALEATTLKATDTLPALSGNPEEQANNERAVLQRKVAATYERQGDYMSALSHLDQAQQNLGSNLACWPGERSRILNDIGWIDFRHGNLEQAEQHLVQALRLAETTNQYDLIASIYNRLGGIEYQRENFDQASSYVARSLELREKIGDIVAVARTYNNLGLLNWKRGEWDSALEYFTRSLTLHANLGDVEGMIEVNNNMGVLQLDRDNIAEARRYMKVSLSSALQIGHAYHVGMAYLHLSLLEIYSENWAGALEYSRLGEEAFARIGVQDHLIELYYCAGMAQFGAGNFAAAEAWGKKALDLYAALDNKSPRLIEDQSRVMRLLGRAARAKKDYAAAEEWLEQSANNFIQAGNEVELARSRVEQAVLAAERGDLAASQVLFQEATHTFEKLGARLDLRKLHEIKI